MRSADRECHTRSVTPSCDMCCKSMTCDQYVVTSGACWCDLPKTTESELVRCACLSLYSCAFLIDSTRRRFRKFGTRVAIHPLMQGYTHQTNRHLLLSEGRCSDELRSLATKHGWPLLEGIDANPAVHACVTMEPRRVCVEYTTPIRIAPDLMRRLAALQSIGHVACFVPCVTAMLDQSMASIGAQALSSTSDLTTWMGSCEQDTTAHTPLGVEHSSPPQWTSPQTRRVSRRIHKNTKGAK